MTKLAAKVQMLANVNKDKGATAVEYGLMVALIAVVIIGAVAALGGKISDMFNTVATNIP
ncbi:Flp family type IVb pilin [Terrabacter sp. NPDC000476]|uniref:Flp family type IVb pilin n=1 Tax=Terrabacter sp. NPDC000476 TaxID=3154258 RepID=UPI003326766B